MSAKILLISPYHGGSHRAWATGYQQYSQHQVQLLTLPARFWKWRMHGGAVTLARQYLAENPRPDLILATDMLNVTTFLALTRPGVPLHLYMHENQLTYPLPANSHSGPMRRQKGERDLHYAFINYASMLAADHVHFNSAYHRHTFLAELPRFLRHFPEYNELDTVAELAARSSVLPVGLDLARLAPPATPCPRPGHPSSCGTNAGNMIRTRPGSSMPSTPSPPRASPSAWPCAAKTSAATPPSSTPP